MLDEAILHIHSKPMIQPQLFLTASLCPEIYFYPTILSSFLYFYFKLLKLIKLISGIKFLINIIRVLVIIIFTHKLSDVIWTRQLFSSYSILCTLAVSIELIEDVNQRVGVRVAYTRSSKPEHLWRHVQYHHYLEVFLY